MKLVETDADRPDDEALPPPVVTPPVPEKRRAYASLIFTLITLIGTVVTIYTVFPARTEESADAAIDAHRRVDQRFLLTSPSRPELIAWATGVLDGTPPLPAATDLQTVGAASLDIRHRPAAYIRYSMGSYEVSYVVQHASDSPAGRSSTVDGADAIESWRDGAWLCIAVGPAAQAAVWKSRVGVP